MCFFSLKQRVMIPDEVGCAIEEKSIFENEIGRGANFDNSNSRQHPPIAPVQILHFLATLFFPVYHLSPRLINLLVMFAHHLASGYVQISRTGFRYLRISCKTTVDVAMCTCARRQQNLPTRIKCKLAWWLWAFYLTTEKMFQPTCCLLVAADLCTTFTDYNLLSSPTRHQ
ncbi:hypothetical protein D917_10098 [Trichinella nativa]|uniref:Uncharacterized protein n=1 Tax=Trichinella nativa TaxID=6335 RepID=A0A1Y3EHF6_9BILA|nr:hypothetical protein D917_10098 [Trichinella nativa]